MLLAVLLGSGHALLPGHGKAVMAAYLAGRRGRPRDAVTVGATVTATHTAGVLVLGLALSLSSSLAGDQVIRWLGVASGLLVAGIGAVHAPGGAARTAAATQAAGRRPGARAGVGGCASGARPAPCTAVAHHEHPHDHEHARTATTTRTTTMHPHDHGARGTPTDRPPAVAG